MIKLITPYLGPLRFGDYSTILKFFAIRSAFADFGIYVIALKQLGKIKNDSSSTEEFATPIAQELATPQETGSDLGSTKEQPTIPSASKQYPLLIETYGKFVSTRFFMIGVVYMLALIVAYFIPAYTSNPYLVRGLPLGMLFSASFMSAGILQLPLQLFWKMKQLTVGLILARVSQLIVIAITVFVLFSSVDFAGSTAHSVNAFVWILLSVVVSGVTQAAYVWRTGKRFLPLKRTRDRSFTKSILSANRQYGFAYYLSSFHTLIVLILLSIFYPTIEGYTYAGTWALGLSLIEILLIVPSALGNSLIHSTAHEGTETQREKFGNLAMLVIWIGCFVTVMFKWFGTPLISFL